MTWLLAVAAMASEGGSDLQTILGMAETYARTGFHADGMEIVIDELLSLEGGYARMAAWASWSAGEPVPTGPSPWLLEFGAGEPTRGMLARVEPGQAVESLMMRLLHEFARGGQPTLPVLADSLVRGEIDNLSEETVRLALQVYGRLGIGGLEESPAVRSLQTPLARYLAETGGGIQPDGVSGMSPLARVYAARAVPVTALGPLLTDPLWAVRYEAAGRADPAELIPLLDDSVPYVALRAASRMREAGLPGAAETIRGLASIPGPVGDQAAAMLGAEDRDLLLELLGSTEPGRRLAAEQAWLSAGLPVDETMDASLMTDPYWLVTISYLESIAASGDTASASERARTLLSTRDDRDLREAACSMLRLEDSMQERPGIPDAAGDCAGYDRAVIHTDEGDITLDLLTDIAPATCRAFCWLSMSGFYDGLWFHRVIPGFVAQAGCPQGNGYGGPGFSLPNERSLVRFRRGVVGMADSGLDTGGSQFFIMLDDHDRLDCRYTAFAAVADGDSILDRLAVGTRIQSVSLLRPGD